MKDKLIVFLILLATLVAYLFIAAPYYSGDVKNHVVWGRSIVEMGPLGFYQREFKDFSFPNYPPISMGLFALFYFFYEFSLSFSKYLNNSFSVFPSGLVPLLEWENIRILFLKLPAILPAVGLGYFIFALTKEFISADLKKQRFIPLLLYILNPAVIYLAVVWGQNDMLQNFFMIGAFYYLIKKKLWISFILAACAIISKQTILMLWGVYIITLYKIYGVKKAAIGLLVSALVLWISYLPFHEFSLSWAFLFYKETLKTTGYLVSDNAINFWGLIFNFQNKGAGDTEFLLPWENWGFLLFIILFVPLIVKFLKEKFSNFRLFYLLFLSSILYFFTLTRMHERYLIPAVVFSIVLIIFNKKYWWNFLFFTVLEFLNLYKGLYQPDIPFLRVSLQNVMFLDFLAILYLGVLTYNYFVFMFKLKSNV